MGFAQLIGRFSENNSGGGIRGWWLVELFLPKVLKLVFGKELHFPSFTCDGPFGFGGYLSRMLKLILRLNVFTGLSVNLTVQL